MGLRQTITGILLILSGLGLSAGTALALPDIVIGLTAEFGMKGAVAAESVENGMRLAIDEINAQGGLPQGRRLVLRRSDDRGLPARGVDNFLDFSADPDVVAVMGGRFSPVALEIAPFAAKQHLLFLDPWAAADGITRQPAPGFVFRLSLTDSWAMQTMLQDAKRRKLKHLAFMLPNTAWGRSCETAARTYAAKNKWLTSETFWYNWGERDFVERLRQARSKGAEAIIMVANDFEGAHIVTQMAAFLPAERLPVISHWGVLGGDFFSSVAAAIQQIDFSVVHTFNFNTTRNAQTSRVALAYKRKFTADALTMYGQVGFAHAYDLTHLLAQAIRKAGSTDRVSVRNALENLGQYDGLVRHYQRPFSPDRHEALDMSGLSMARFDRNGLLVEAHRPGGD